MILIGEGIVVKFIEKEGLRVEFICWIILFYLFDFFFFIMFRFIGRCCFYYWRMYRNYLVSFLMLKTRSLSVIF